MSRLDELRTLLVKPEQDALDELRERVEARDRRVADVAEILPDSITESHRDGRFTPAIREPLAEVMTDAIRQDPEAYADALFPIIGPAIRRAVAEAFRSLTQQLNQAIEHSLTPKGLRWRLEAWRSGIPFSQYLLQQTLLYRVEEAYLIHADSGLLVAHVHDESLPLKDEDAVSAMLTALQEFIKDAFSGQQSGGLETAEVGELTVWLIHGPQAILACVIRGMPPRGLRGELREVLEKIEGGYRRPLERFDGDRRAFASAEPILRRCLRSSLRPDTKAERSRWFTPVNVILLALVLLLIALAARGIYQRMEIQRLQAALSPEPGIVVSEVKRRDGRLHISGLRDPLAAPLDSLLATAGFAPDTIESELVPFVSLDAEIVLRRASAALSPPAGVSMRHDGDSLHISGIATEDWIRQARADLRLLPGLEGAVFDVSMESPEIPSGSAEEFAAVRQRIEATSIDFTGGIAMSAMAEQDLRRLASDCARLDALAGELGRTVSYTVTGHSDASGTDAINLALMQRRARRVADALIGAGVPESLIEPSTDDLRKPRVSARSATISVSATEREGQ